MKKLLIILVLLLVTFGGCSSTYRQGGYSYNPGTGLVETIGIGLYDQRPYYQIVQDILDSPYPPGCNRQQYEEQLMQQREMNRHLRDIGSELRMQRIWGY